MTARTECGRLARMTRRSFLAKLCALVAAPVALMGRGVERQTPPAPDYSRATWSNIPMNDDSVVGAYLVGPKHSRWFSRDEWRSLQERKEKRA